MSTPVVTLAGLDFDPYTASLNHCDRCGALAKVHVEMPSGHDLKLCRHHGVEYAPKLRANRAKFTIVDGDGGAQELLQLLQGAVPAH
jgi:hypothetical protein